MTELNKEQFMANGNTLSMNREIWDMYFSQYENGDLNETELDDLLFQSCYYDFDADGNPNLVK